MMIYAAFYCVIAFGSDTSSNYCRYQPEYGPYASKAECEQALPVGLRWQISGMPSKDGAMEGLRCLGRNVETSR